MTIYPVVHCIFHQTLKYFKYKDPFLKYKYKVKLTKYCAASILIVEFALLMHYIHSCTLKSTLSDKHALTCTLQYMLMHAQV